MTTLPFTLRQLDVFATLCRSMSFRKCANDLNVSQAAVSNQIKTLETQLGISLFLRTPGRAPRLTAEGQAFLSDLKACELALNQLATHRLQVPRGPEQTHFRVLIAAGLMERFIKPQLDDFIARYPSVECEFIPQLPSVLPNKGVEEGQFDLALYHITAEADVPPGLTVLARVSSGLIGHHSLAANRCLPLSAEEASDLPMILPLEGGIERQRLLAALAKRGVTPRNIVGQTAYFDVMARMIERGTGVASLPIALLPDEARASTAMLFPITDWLLVWHRKPELHGQTVDALEHFLKSAILDNPSYAQFATCGQQIETASI